MYAMERVAAGVAASVHVPQATAGTPSLPPGSNAEDHSEERRGKLT